MGAKDIERQQPNVFRMRLLGAEVRGVSSGSRTLKDATNEALRELPEVAIRNAQESRRVVDHVHVAALIGVQRLIEHTVLHDPSSNDREPASGEAMSEKPEIDFPGGEAPTELVIDDIVEGTGAEAVPGATVLVHYVGVDFESGDFEVPGGVRVALTRDDDTYLILPERSAIARRLGADLFISIHADSAGEQATGSTIYTLSEVASDREAHARWSERYWQLKKATDQLSRQIENRTGAGGTTTATTGAGGERAARGRDCARF